MVNEINEKKIIEGILKEDKESLDELISLYGKLVYYIANSILVESHEKRYLDECYDDVFISLWFNMDCFDDEKGSLKSWIVSITKYKAIDIKRKISSHNKTFEYKDEVTNIKNDCSLENIENNKLIEDLLNTLEDKDREIFLKRYLIGISIEEIAQELGYSKEYIYTRISRAGKKMRRMAGDINGW
jgi:RNA polymerase sigma-70 factor (ECF subfamily)